MWTLSRAIQLAGVQRDGIMDADKLPLHTRRNSWEILCFALSACLLANTVYSGARPELRATVSNYIFVCLDRDEIVRASVKGSDYYAFGFVQYNSNRLKVNDNCFDLGIVSAGRSSAITSIRRSDNDRGERFPRIEAIKFSLSLQVSPVRLGGL